MSKTSDTYGRQERLPSKVYLFSNEKKEFQRHVPIETLRCMQNEPQEDNGFFEDLNCSPFLSYAEHYLSDPALKEPGPDFVQNARFTEVIVLVPWARVAFLLD